MFDLITLPVGRGLTSIRKQVEVLYNAAFNRGESIGNWDHICEDCNSAERHHIFTVLGVRVSKCPNCGFEVKMS